MSASHPRPYRILIASSAPVIREGMAAMIHPFFGQESKYFYAQTQAEVRHLLQQYTVDLLIVEVELAEEEGINWTEIKFTQPQLRTVLLHREDADGRGGRFDHHIALHTSKEELFELLLRLFPKTSSTPPRPEEDALSTREEEILQLMVSGRTTKQIAELLHLSHHTVSTHRKNIISKLGIKTLAGLTVYAIMKGLVDLDDMKNIH